MFTLETVRSLLGIDPHKATQVAAVLNGGDPNKFKSVQAWVAQCDNEPSDDEKRLCALNELLDGFGVEAIRVEGEWDRYFGDSIASYVNLGDTYTTTIVFDHDLEEFHLTSWGDFLESWEQGQSREDEPDVDWLTEHEDFAHDNDY